MAHMNLQHSNGYDPALPTSWITWHMIALERSLACCGHLCRTLGKHLLLEEELPSVAFVLLLNCAEPAKSALSFPQLPQSTCVKVTETGHCYRKKKIPAMAKVCSARNLT